MGILWDECLDCNSTPCTCTRPMTYRESLFYSVEQVNARNKAHKEYRRMLENERIKQKGKKHTGRAFFSSNKNITMVDMIDGKFKYSTVVK